MYKHRHCHKHRKIAQYLLFCCSLFVHTIVWGLLPDHKQQIEITSDSADFDGAAGITSYYGNVVLTQGSIRIKGDTLLVYVKDNALDRWVMKGNLVKYRQRSSNSEEYNEAEALNMEYRHTAGIIILTGKAHYKQDRLSFSGEKMEYDLKNERLKINNNNQEQSSETDTNERIKVIIKP